MGVFFSVLDAFYGVRRNVSGGCMIILEVSIRRNGNVVDLKGVGCVINGTILFSLITLDNAMMGIWPYFEV